MMAVVIEAWHRLRYVEVIRIRQKREQVSR